VGVMKRTRISTVLVEQEGPRLPIDCPKSRRSGANRVEVAEISSAFPARSAEDLAAWP